MAEQDRTNHRGGEVGKKKNKTRNWNLDLCFYSEKTPDGKEVFGLVYICTPGAFEL